MPGAFENVPRDDRAWPRASLPTSVVLLLVAAAGGVGAVFGASGTWMTALVAACYAGTFGLVLAVSVPGMRHWIAGEDVPGRLRLIQLVSVIAPFVALGLLDVLVGCAMVAGMMDGLLVANVWAIRSARANRGLVDEAEASAARTEPTPSPTGSPTPSPTPSPAPTAYPPPPVSAGATRGESVGRVLRAAVRLEIRRVFAWPVAGAVCLLGAALDVPQRVTNLLLVTSAGAFLWVLRRLFATWLALRDFTRAATPPRRAFVVLLHDPAPKAIRPLLAVWSLAPTLRGGRLPRPELVYRCDEDRDDLVSFQGGIVVHEAWVDTGPRRWSRPRWVAADAGIALPHRRSAFGRWYVGNLISGDRPDPPQPLTIPPPHPDNVEASPIVENGGDGGSFVGAVAGRLAVLVVFGAIFYWLT